MDDEKFRTSRASDVYSLAMIVWFTWSGQLPFSPRRKREIITAVESGVRPPRPTLVPAERMFDESTEDQLWELVERMWAHDPKDRPNSANVKVEMKIILKKATLD